MATHYCQQKHLPINWQSSKNFQFLHNDFFSVFVDKTFEKMIGMTSSSCVLVAIFGCICPMSFVVNGHPLDVDNTTSSPSLSLLLSSSLVNETSIDFDDNWSQNEQLNNAIMYNTIDMDNLQRRQRAPPGCQNICARYNMYATCVRCTSYCRKNGCLPNHTCRCS